MSFTEDPKDPKSTPQDTSPDPADPRKRTSNPVKRFLQYAAIIAVGVGLAAGVEIAYLNNKLVNMGAGQTGEATQDKPSSPESMYEKVYPDTQMHTVRDNVSPVEVASVDGPASYAGDPAGTRFYAATQINPSNVKSLRPTWTTFADFGGGAALLGPGPAATSGFECSPIICDGRLIIVTPTQALIALNPVTGFRMWRYEPRHYEHVIQVCRGPSEWNGPPSDPHPHRIIYAYRRFLCEVDADTGEGITEFGDSGAVDLADGIDRGHPDLVLDNSPPAHCWRYGHMRHADHGRCHGSGAVRHCARLRHTHRQGALVVRSHTAATKCRRGERLVDDELRSTAPTHLLAYGERVQ